MTSRNTQKKNFIFSLACSVATRVAVSCKFFPFLKFFFRNFAFDSNRRNRDANSQMQLEKEWLFYCGACYAQYFILLPLLACVHVFTHSRISYLQFLCRFVLLRFWNRLAFFRLLFWHAIIFQEKEKKLLHFTNHSGNSWTESTNCSENGMLWVNTWNFLEVAPFVPNVLVQMLYFRQ